MRLILSFFLALISYFIILFFLYLALQKEEKKPVLIHHAVIVPKIQTPKKSIKTTTKKILKKAKKSKKSGSKSNITKGGKVDFNDIFKNVNYSVPTKKINIKKEPVLSRFRANNILKKLQHIKNINVNISFNTTTNIKKQKLDEIIEKIGNIWYEISDIAGEYATIKFINNNGRVEVYILDTNLNPNKEARLLESLKSIKFNQNIDLTIKFQTKANK